MKFFAEAAFQAPGIDAICRALSLHPVLTPRGVQFLSDPAGGLFQPLQTSTPSILFHRVGNLPVTMKR